MNTNTITPCLWSDTPMHVGSQEIHELRRPYLPCAIFTEVIWGEQRVQEMWVRYRRWRWVGFLSRFFFIARTPFFPCAFTHSDTDLMAIRTETGAKRSEGQIQRPSAGWGSSLCCWSGWHITPCGDDCAIYCLAGAGDLRQRKQTGSAWRTGPHFIVCQHNRLIGDAHALTITKHELKVVRKSTECVNWNTCKVNICVVFFLIYVNKVIFTGFTGGFFLISQF